MSLYKEKYRIESSRLKDWDYSSPGIYFITICTKDRLCLFGNIEKGEMIFSECGLIVKEEWEKSFDIRKELVCDAYVIMPNHIHAIIYILEKQKDCNVEVETHGQNNNTIPNDNVETHSRASLRYSNTGVSYRPPKSISSFVAGFKSITTKRINILTNTKESIWQSRFYDHIIRNKKELNAIRKYIMHNPIKWQEDQYFNGGLK
ncbi:MAG: transposase [Brevinematia bacterium]